MKNQKSFILHHRLSVLLIVLSVPSLAICAISSVSSTAQTPQQERVIEDKIPKHLPIKVKVNNLDKVKDLNNERWVDDLEVEVKNVSDKPIYFLDIQLVLPEMKSADGYEISFTLRYGRIQLIDLGEPLQSDDVPIRPGESYTFKIPEKNVKGWKGFVSERRLQKSEPKRIQLEFYLLNFGDGTGYRNSTGKAFDIHKKKAMNGSCGEKEDKNLAIATLLTWPPAPPLQSQVSFIPANFQPV